MIKKLKWWHLLVGTVSLILISVLALHFYLRWSLANYKAELASKGETLAFPYVVNDCEDKEAAAEVWKAYDALPALPSHATPRTMRTIAPGKAQVASATSALTPEEIEEWRSLEKFATAVSPIALDQLIVAVEKECINLGLSFDNTKPTAQLGNYRALMQKLQLMTVWNLRKTNVIESVRCAKSFLNAINGAAKDPGLLIELVRIAMAGIGVSLTWEILQYDLPLLQATMLQTAWERQEWRSKIADIERVERIALISEIEELKTRDQFNSTIFWNGKQEAIEALDQASDTLLINPIESLSHLSKATMLGNAYPYWEVFGRYSEIEAMLRNSQARIGQAFRLSATDCVLSSFPRELHPTPLLTYALDSDSIHRKYRERIARAETQRDMVVAAIALYRYKKAKGEYPERLEELAPTYLSKMPIDWFVAKPMQYRKQNDGTYLLYSVGVNLKDDGGQPGEKGGLFTQTGDVVWPWPATEEEIKRANQEKRK